MSSSTVLIPQVEQFLDKLPACQTRNDRERLRIVYNKRFRESNPEQYAECVKKDSEPVTERSFDAVNLPANWNVF